MCGVVALFARGSLAPPVDRAELRAIRDHMAARGPDGAGEWYSEDGRAGLGHRRLAVIDLNARAAQPMRSADGALAISFNGEIYNWRELRAGLERDGHRFHTESDTEVLLRLYEAHGVGMLDKLRGMFAFALWDGNRRAMLLARDAFGMKPLFYADGPTFRAASQVKALLRADVDTSPEPAGHAGYFLWGSVPAPWTLYRGIRSLPAGHYLWVNENGTEAPQSYCLLPGVLAASALAKPTGSREDALDDIAGALGDSLSAHLVSDVPVGVFLSAGLDSCMLATLAAARNAELRTLTLAFAEHEGRAEDEAPLAAQVARSLGALHTTVTVARQEFEDEQERFFTAMDQPSIDGMNMWFVARAARDLGMKVALSGTGGDELFGSYPSFTQVPLLSRLAGPFSAAGKPFRALSTPLARAFSAPKLPGLLEYGGTLGGAYFLRRALHMPWELPRLMDPEMARQGWADLQLMQRLEATCAPSRDAGSPRLAVSALELSWYMRHQLLADSDWSGMAHSLEIRTPFVDLPLLRRIAPWLAAYPTINKREIAAHVAPALARTVLDKGKTGFVVPTGQWLGASGSHPRHWLRPWSQLIHSRATVRHS